MEGVINRPKKVGAKVSHYRNEAGLSQKELADMIGVPQSTIARIEVGRQKQVRLEYLERIARVLNVTLHHLLEDENSIEHLPLYLQKFVCNPENKDWIHKAYIMSEASKLKMDSK